MTALTKSTHDQANEEYALEQLENIYYSGYCQDADPERIAWEIKDMLSQLPVKK